MQLREPEWRRLEVNEVDLTALAQRLARSLGIEPYLESVFLPGDLEIGRFLVLMSLGVWALVLLTVMNTMLLRYILPKQSPGPNRERLVESARTLRRVGHRTRRTGYVMLLIGFLVALPLLLVGAKYALQSLMLGALIHFGLLQPAWLIAELYGRTFETSGNPEVSAEKFT